MNKITIIACQFAVAPILTIVDDPIPSEGEALVMREMAKAWFENRKRGDGYCGESMDDCISWYSNIATRREYWAGKGMVSVAITAPRRPLSCKLRNMITNNNITQQ